MKTTTRNVSVDADGLILSGILHLPSCTPLALIVGCHGLMADKTSPKQIDLARQCAEKEMAYFRFDHRGCGESEGDFETDTTLEGRTTDLLAVVRELPAIMDREDIPIGLFGSSLGGTVCLSAASRIQPFSIVTLAAPVQRQAIHLPEHSPESLKTEFRQNGLHFDITDDLHNIHHILVIHGDEDETVPVQNAHLIYKLSCEPKKLLILRNGDHRITDEIHQKQYTHDTVQWFKAYCPGSSENENN
ncbi:alpha/beta hydrolase [Desulfosarcina sp. OttesenSCG-928-A07]|nr:alpha/beta hydrolase [Desulfosarcina sp. OttesenSCG-928-A07]